MQMLNTARAHDVPWQSAEDWKCITKYWLYIEEVISSLLLQNFRNDWNCRSIVTARVNCAISHYICPDFPLVSIGWPWSHGYRVSLAPFSLCSPSILTIFNYASLFRSFAFFLFRLLLCFCCCFCCCLPAPSMRKLLLIWTSRSVCTFALPRLQRAAPTRSALSLSLTFSVAPLLTLSQCWPSLGNFNCNFCFLLAQLATPTAALVSLCFSGHVCNIFVEISLKITLKSLLSFR